MIELAPPEALEQFEAQYIVPTQPDISSGPQQHEWTWRSRASACAAVLVTALSVSGCWLTGSGSSSESSSGDGGAPAPAASAPANTGEAAPTGVDTLALWAKDGCLEYLVLDSNNDTVAVSATNLCRTTTVSFPGSSLAGPGTYYEYFARGTDPATKWQLVSGQESNGYNVWEYSDGELWGQPAGGGNIQLVVNTGNGQEQFEDLNTFLQDNPGGLNVAALVVEDLVSGAIAREEIGTTVQQNPQLPSDAASEVQTAQSDIATQNQQAQQTAQTYQSASSQGGSAARELIEEGQSRENFFKILYSKDCTESDNVEAGCGGSSAFNDDGGAGEGNN